MDDIARIERGELDIFDPARHRLKVAALDYSIEEAKRIKDWPKLEEAVDAKIEEQRKFVVWWKANIQPAIRPTKKSPGTRLLSVADAERLIGMRQQRVSDLGQRLKQADKYREIMLGAGYRAAMQCDGMAMAAMSEVCLPFADEVAADGPCVDARDLGGGAGLGGGFLFGVPSRANRSMP